MPRVKFTAMYDHNFATGGMMNFPEGHEGPVKQEVADAAIAAGRARLVRPPRDKDAPKRRRRRRKAATTTAAGLPVKTPQTASATPAAPAAPLTDARDAGTLSTAADSE